MIGDNLELTEKFYGEKTVLLAKSGYGKSYTARVVVEEGLKKSVTFIIIDPQDAHLNYPGVEYIDAKNVKSVKDFAKLIALSHKNICIRMKHLSVEDQNIFLHHFITEYRKHQHKGIKTIILEEAHKYCPEAEKTESKNIIRGMFQEDRSSGLGIIAITQRPQRLDKTCLSQADNIAAGRVTSKRDCDAVAQYIDDANDIEKIKVLQKGQFFLNGFDLEQNRIVQIRTSESRHSGDSPKNLLREDSITYDRHISKFAKRGINTMENTVVDAVKHAVPFTHGGWELTKFGMKASLGLFSASFVGGQVGRYMPKIPFISGRTVGSMANTAILYAGYRFVPNETAKDVLFVAAGSSAAYTFGSIIGDTLKALNVKLPNIFGTSLAAATGSAPSSAKDVNNEPGVQPIEEMPAF